MKKDILKIILELLFLVLGASIAYRYSFAFGNLFLILYFASKIFIKRYLFYSMKGSKLYNRNNIDEAMKYFEKASNIATCKPRVIISYAYLLLREGYIEKATDTLKKIYGLKLEEKDEMNAKMTLSLIEWKKDDLDKAIEILEEVYDKYKNSTLYESLGYMLILKGDYERALKFNQEAYDYNASDVVLDNLGESYYYTGNHEKAYEIFEELVKKNVYFPEPYYFFGLLLKEQGKKEEALEIFNKAMSCKESFLSNLNKEKIQAEIEKLG